MNYEFQDLEALKQGIEELNQDVSQELSEGAKEMRAMTGGQVGALAYGIQKISDIPAVNEKIQDCKEGFNHAVENAKEAITEFGTRVTEGIKDYCCGVYENIKDFFTGGNREAVSDTQFPEMAKLSEGITEGREFGLEECSEAALEIFNPGVIAEWGSMTWEEKKDIACLYAEKVAEAFELESYKGVIIEDMGLGTLGSNNGDGTIHISESLFDAYNTPFQLVDTITHELRHQYQSECIRGEHDISEEVKNEWTMATAIYSYEEPNCFDPWGYSYNPLEIDSNYAGNTVVRNVTSQIFNDTMNLIA